MFWDSFYNICLKNNTKPTPVAKNLGISVGSLTKWKNGTLPTGETLEKIADYFDCSIDELMGRHTHIDSSISAMADTIGVVGSSHAPININHKLNFELSAQEKDFIRIYRSLTGKEQHSLMSYAYELEEKGIN